MLAIHYAINSDAPKFLGMKDTISLLSIMAALLFVLAIFGMLSATERTKWIPRIVRFR